VSSNNLWLFRAFKTVGLVLALGISTSVCASFLGFGGDSWKEEVLLHDGSKIIVERSQSYGGNHEIGQTPPIKEQEITFTVPSTGKTLTFKSEFSEDIGRANFDLLALDILNGTPYIIASPNLCLSYNKWGRPNPPYVIYKHDGTEWKRITLQELPAEFKDFNMVIETKGNLETLKAHSIVSAELVKQLNGELRQPEYRSILREPAAIEENRCPDLERIEGGWQTRGGFRRLVPVPPPEANQKK